MPYKTIEEVSQKLAERYDGPTYQREGQGGKMFTYIPWHVSVRLLNEIFGVFGWTSTTPLMVCAEGQWTVSFSITARVLDENGNLIEKTVPCLGSATARDDNSAKSALSDALSKGVKFYGDAFGFYLSEEKTTTAAPRQGNATSYSLNTTNGALGGNYGSSTKPITDKQVQKLKGLGYNGPFDGMTTRTASQKIEELLNQTPEPVF